MLIMFDHALTPQLYYLVPKVPTVQLCSCTVHGHGRTGEGPPPVRASAGGAGGEGRLMPSLCAFFLHPLYLLSSHLFCTAAARSPLPLLPATLASLSRGRATLLHAWGMQAALEWLAKAASGHHVAQVRWAAYRISTDMAAVGLTLQHFACLARGSGCYCCIVCCSNTLWDVARLHAFAPSERKLNARACHV